VRCRHADTWRTVASSSGGAAKTMRKSIPCVACDAHGTVGISMGVVPAGDCVPRCTQSHTVCLYQEAPCASCGP
jgi:hypothetical protein